MLQDISITRRRGVSTGLVAAVVAIACLMASTAQAAGPSAVANGAPTTPIIVGGKGVSRMPLNPQPLPPR